MPATITAIQHAQILNLENKSHTREFHIGPPAVNGDDAVEFVLEVQAGDGSGESVSVDIQFQGPDGTWIDTAATSKSATGTFSTRWYPKMRAVATITASNGGSAASKTVAVSLGKSPYHGDMLQLKDSLTKGTISVVWYATPGGSGDANPDQEDRPQDRMWYLPITGTPGVLDVVADVTACRDDLLTLMASLNTDHYFRVTGSSNGLNRIDLTHDVNGSVGNVLACSAPSDAWTTLALESGTGVSTGVSLTASTVS